MCLGTTGKQFFNFKKMEYSFLHVEWLNVYKYVYSGTLPCRHPLKYGHPL